jgi:hypothetical protein
VRYGFIRGGAPSFQFFTIEKAFDGHKTIGLVELDLLVVMLFISTPLLFSTIIPRKAPLP